MRWVEEPRGTFTLIRAGEVRYHAVDAGDGWWETRPAGNHVNFRTRGTKTSIMRAIEETVRRWDRIVDINRKRGDW